MNRVLAILLVFSLLVGCGGGANQKNTASITFWQFWTSPDVKPTVDSLMNDFESKNPGISVELVDLTWSDGHEKIVVAFSTGHGPDVVELGSDWINEFAANGQLANVDDIFSETGSALSMWETSLFDSNHYAVPWLLGTRVLFTNMTLLNEVGIVSDSPPRNWPDLLAAAQMIQGLGKPYYGFGSNSAERHRLYKKFLPFLWSNGGEVITASSSCGLSTPEAVEALEYYVELSDQGYLATQRELEDKFMAGELGFIITGDWMLNRIAKSPPNFEIRTSVVPPPDSMHTSISFAGGEYLAVNRKSENQVAAKKLVRFLVEPDADRRFATSVGSPTPANKSSVPSESDSIRSLAEAFTQQLATSRMTPAHPKWVYIEEVLEKAIEKAIYHKASAKDALTEATEQIDKILAEPK